MTKGKLYLIPSTLGPTSSEQVIPAPCLELLQHIDCYVVEELRTVRRFLSQSGLKGRIDSLELHELNEHSKAADVEKLLGLFENGRNVGLISEAGLPAVADPGANLVALCHSHGIEVCPQVGPSSLMLALMASGLNGQSFAFRGYLPAKTDERRKAIKEAEKMSLSLSQTQIFIETPYRNDSLLKDLIAGLSPHCRLCIAADLTLESQFVRTMTVQQWKKENMEIGKRPCVFLFLAQ